MADDLSLLFKIRGDASGAKQATAETRAAVAQLKQSLGPDLSQATSLTNKVISDLGNNLNTFVGARLPLIGGAFVRISENVRGFGGETQKATPLLNAFNKSVDTISQTTGKGNAEIIRFLSSFTRIPGEGARASAAFKTFGADAATLIPTLEKASTQLVAVAGSEEAAGAAAVSMAGPIGIAVLALGALAAGAAVAAKEVFSLAKQAAEFQGKLFDLSQQTGVSVETLSALEVVARTTGSSIESLSQSLGIFQKNLESAAEDPASKAAVAFHKLEVDATDTEAALRQTIAALAAMPEGFRQTALALEVFGRGGKAFLAIAKESKGDIDEVVRRLKDMGLVTTEQAKLADEFNDQLVLLEVQLRGLGTQAIPVVLDAAKDLSVFLRDNREAIVVLQGVIKGLALSITVPLKAALATLKEGLVIARPALQITAELFERIKGAIEFIIRHPISIAGFAPSVPTPAPAPSADKDPNTAIRKEIEDRQKLQGLIRFMLADEKRQAEDRIATAQREFEAGHITREQLLQEILLGNRKKAQAEIDELKVDRAIKVEQEKLAKDDVEKQRQIGDSILAIDAQIADKKAALQRSAADLTAKSQLEERKDQLVHEQATLAILTKGGEDRIARIENEIRAGITKREEGLRKIEEIENAALVARGQLLKRELELAGVGPDRQAVLDKIAAVENDRTELERKQSARRIQITQDETAEKVATLLASAETTGRIAETVDASRIASLRASAALRVRSEEETEKAILQIRLAAIDREDDLARIRNTAAKAQIDAQLSAIQEARRDLEGQLQNAASIQDPTKRVEEQTRVTKALQQNVDEEIAAQGQANKDRNRLDRELNDQLRVNNAERLGIQSQGERDIEDGRQRDLENEERYADDLKQIKERIRDIERDSARTVIELMRLHFASRKDIIRAERDLEDERHRIATASINEQKREIDAQIKLLEVHVDALKIGTTEEIEQYERIIAELEKLRLKRLELKAQQDAEDKRNQAVTDQSTRDEDQADPFGKIGLGDEDVADFKSQVEDSIVPLNQLLANSFFQVADAIGAVVEQWVLYGSTGPAVMRKILATALATIAKEATVNAIKELAIAFALLATGQPGAGAAFASAALWASIAGASAVAGRAVAGDLFKSPTASSGGSGSRSGGSSGSSSDAARPIDLTRTQQTQELHIFIHGEAGPGFHDEVFRGIVNDVHSNGPMRAVFKKVAED